MYSISSLITEAWGANTPGWELLVWGKKDIPIEQLLAALVVHFLTRLHEFKVCQKDWEPTVITINHREIIKEQAVAVRLTEVHGWKGPLDVLGGIEAHLRDLHHECFNLLVFELKDSSALRWLYLTTLSYKISFLIMCVWLFASVYCSCISPDFTAFLLDGKHLVSMMPDRSVSIFWFYFTVIDIHVICQHSLTTARYADFDGSHSHLSELKQ